MQRFQRGGNNNPEQMQQQFARLQQQSMQGLNSVLTPEQQQNWAQMTGQPHNFPAGAYFGSQGQATQGQPNQGAGQNPAGVVPNGAGAAGGQGGSQNQGPATGTAQGTQVQGNSVVR